MYWVKIYIRLWCMVTIRRLKCFWLLQPCLEQLYPISPFEFLGLIFNWSDISTDSKRDPIVLIGHDARKQTQISFTMRRCKMSIQGRKSHTAFDSSIHGMTQWVHRVLMSLDESILNSVANCRRPRNQSITDPGASKLDTCHPMRYE